MAPRDSWDLYFMNIATVVASRATCNRRHVGAVLVRDRSILATGYNGSVRGLPHCDDEDHMMENGHCVRTVHAEANAVAQAAKHGVRVGEATLYVTASPCWPCFKLVANAGVKRIVFGEFYRDQRIYDAARLSGIELVDLTKELTAVVDRAVDGLISPPPTAKRADVFRAVDGIPTILEGTAHSAVVDENGVVHVLDENGGTLMMMNEHDYNELLKDREDMRNKKEEMG